MRNWKGWDVAAACPERLEPSGRPEASRWLFPELRPGEDVFRAFDIFQNLLAQSFRPGEFLLLAQPLQEPHFHQPSGQRLREIEQMRFDRQTLAIER